MLGGWETPTENRDPLGWFVESVGDGVSMMMSSQGTVM